MIDLARVMTSGRMLRVAFKSAAVKSVASAPIIRVNGSSVGQAVPRVVDGSLKSAYFEFPAGVAVNPSDKIEIDAPDRWAATASGVEPSVSAFPVENCTGRSAWDTDSLPKTLRFGSNTEGYEYGPFLKNRAKMIGFGRYVAEYGENMRPLRFTQSRVRTSVYSVIQGNWPNGLDDTGNPGPVGLWGVQWWDTNPDDPLTISFAAAGDNTVATDRKDMYYVGPVETNVTIDGVTYAKAQKKTRFADFQTKPGSSKVYVDVDVIFEQSKSKCSFAGLVINAPGDFVYEDGKPTTLDDSDPYAMSPWFIERYKGSGGIRNWTAGSPNASPNSVEAGDLRRLEDSSWSWVPNKRVLKATWIKAEPFDRSKFPWTYSATFGDKYVAELVARVEPSDTAVRIRDAENLGIFDGRRLFIDGEVMRVIGAPEGDRVNVVRAIEKTKAVAHDPGPVMAGYRMPIPEIGKGFYSNGCVMVLTSQDPHGWESLIPTDWQGAWPSIETTDGRKVKVASGATVDVVGPRQVVVKEPMDPPGGTIKAPVDLSGCTSVVGIPGMGGLPIGMAARMKDQLQAIARFYIFPPLLTDDAIDEAWTTIRDNTKPGGENVGEVGCEPWNYWGQKVIWQAIAAIRHPGKNLYRAIVDRTGQIRERGRRIFAEHGRQDEVKMMLNVQFTWPEAYGLDAMKYASEQKIPIDYMAGGVYITGDAKAGEHKYIPASVRPVFATLDIPESIDLWLASLCDNNTNKGLQAWSSAQRKIVADYNAAMGSPVCKWMGYEGGPETIFDKTFIPDAVAKERDFMHHPNMFIGYQDLIALFQREGYAHFLKTAAFVLYSQGRFLWGDSHAFNQGYSRGLKNLEIQARQGLARSKRPDQNYDKQVDSVLVHALRAWLDPMMGTVPPPVDPPPVDPPPVNPPPVDPPPITVPPVDPPPVDPPPITAPPVTDTDNRAAEIRAAVERVKAALDQFADAIRNVS